MRDSDNSEPLTRRQITHAGLLLFGAWLVFVLAIIGLIHLLELFVKA